MARPLLPINPAKGVSLYQAPPKQPRTGRRVGVRWTTEVLDSNQEDRTSVGRLGGYDSVCRPCAVPCWLDAGFLCMRLLTAMRRQPVAVAVIFKDHYGNVSNSAVTQRQ